MKCKEFPKNFYVVDRISELFLTGIPELDKPNALFDFLDSDHIKEMPLKSLYLIEFTDGTIKVGVSQNAIKRINVVEKQAGRVIKRHYISEPVSNAFKIENLIKSDLLSSRLNGEIYIANFDDVCLKIKTLIQ